MLTSEKMQTAVCTVSVMHGLECGTDHELVRGKLKMFIKRKVRATGAKNKLHEKLLSTDGTGKIAAEQAFKKLKSRLQCEIRHMKNRWRSEISA